MNGEPANIKDPNTGGITHHSGGTGNLRPESRQQSQLTTLPILPVADRPFFPRQVVSLILSKAQWQETIKKVQASSGNRLGIVMVRGDSIENTHISDFHSHGTIARVGKVSLADGQIQFMAEGIQRFRVARWLTTQSPYIAEVEYLEKSAENREEILAYGDAITDTIKELLPLRPRHFDELQTFIDRFSPQDSESFADFGANLLTTKKEQLQEILATEAIIPRMELVLKLVRKKLEVTRLRERVNKRVEESLSENQRKAILRTQLKEIQKELGITKSDRSSDEERFRERLEGRDVPTHLRQRVDEEFEKFSTLEAVSPEYAVTRNYLDWLTVLPWEKYTQDNFELSRARNILSVDHYGLEDVKERIIEFLAVGAFKGAISGSILLLVGPPGVGKTSIGRAIANALDRRFYRFSLGGMRDEAEIKGHRRTYIGAMPGKFLQAMKEVDACNPVIMLDEIDKIGASYRGDPASALLEALDPEQNSEFLDHYLDLRFDLSKALFIGTANQVDTIPVPLLDRMETINLAGYMTQEKIEIARRHLWPKQLEKAGVASSQITITDSVLLHIAGKYAREAGVRNFEKQLGRIVRKGVVKLIEAGSDPIHVDEAQLESYLGTPKFRVGAPRTGIGVVTGLAWTSMGGETLTVEAMRVHTKNRGFQLTGNLGDVMKESASIAHNYITANAAHLDANAGYLDEAFVHLHVPEGATPKDGPSAGVTMATSLLSLARQQPVQRTLAMSGELTLTGQVLPVGGIKEKIMAAIRANIDELILPADNQPDFDSLPDQLREGLRIHFVRNFREVAQIVFSQSEDLRPDICVSVDPAHSACVQMG